jgi:hypothetical protein
LRGKTDATKQGEQQESVYGRVKIKMKKSDSRMNVVIPRLQEYMFFNQV